MGFYHTHIDIDGDGLLLANPHQIWSQKSENIYDPVYPQHLIRGVPYLSLERIKFIIHSHLQSFVATRWHINSKQSHHSDSGLFKSLTSAPGKLASTVAPAPKSEPPGLQEHLVCSSCTDPSSTARTDLCLGSPVSGTASNHQA